MKKKKIQIEERLWKFLLEESHSLNYPAMNY